MWIKKWEKKWSNQPSGKAEGIRLKGCDLKISKFQYRWGSLGFLEQATCNGGKAQERNLIKQSVEFSPNVGKPCALP